MIDGENEETELLLDTPLGEDEEGGEATDQQADGSDDEVVFEIEGEGVDDDGHLVKHLRSELDRKNARIKDLEASNPRQQAIEVGEKPTLEGCEWDDQRYERELLAWHNRKAQADQQERTSTEQAQERNRVFEKARGSYRAKAAALGVKDFDEIEKVVISQLPENVQGAIVQYMDDPAKVVYALGKYPATLAKIAAEPDALRQILMIRDMEKKVKRKAPPAPEADTIQRGSAPVAATNNDKRLAQLEKEAERTGDRTKIIQFKRQMKEKAK